MIRGGNGTGSIVSEPPGIACPPTCTAPFPASSQVTLIALPDPASPFLGWKFGCTVSTIDPRRCTLAATNRPNWVGVALGADAVIGVPTTLAVLFDVARVGAGRDQGSSSSTAARNASIATCSGRGRSCAPVRADGGASHSGTEPAAGPRRARSTSGRVTSVRAMFTENLAPKLLSVKATGTKAARKVTVRLSVRHAAAGSAAAPPRRATRVLADRRFALPSGANAVVLAVPAEGQGRPLAADGRRQRRPRRRPHLLPSRLRSGRERRRDTGARRAGAHPEARPAQVARKPLDRGQDDRRRRGRDRRGARGRLPAACPTSRPEPTPQEGSATFEKPTLEQPVTFGQYLRRVELPPRGYTPKQLQQAGVIAAVQLTIKGYRGKSLPLRWYALDLGTHDIVDEQSKRYTVRARPERDAAHLAVLGRAAGDSRFVQDRASRSTRRMRSPASRAWCRSRRPRRIPSSAARRSVRSAG